jgi:outer membrane protein assembly factor BamB
LTLTSFYQPALGTPAQTAGKDLDLTTAFVFGPGNLGIASGKDGTLHVLDRTTMKSVQDVLVSTNPPTGSGTGGGHIHGGPVYWDGSMGPRVYVWPEGTDPMKVFAATSSGVATTPVAQYSQRLPSHPGGIITISSNGKVPGTGILWAAMVTSDTADAWHGLQSGTLYALDAENPSDSNPKALLWDSDAAVGDQLGLFAKFCPPTVANGKVYIGTAIGTDNSNTAELRVYGLNP